MAQMGLRIGGPVVRSQGGHLEAGEKTRRFSEKKEKTAGCPGWDRIPDLGSEWTPGDHGSRGRDPSPCSTDGDVARIWGSSSQKRMKRNWSDGNRGRRHELRELCLLPALLIRGQISVEIIQWATASLVRPLILRSQVEQALQHVLQLGLLARQLRKLPLGYRSFRILNLVILDGFLLRENGPRSFPRLTPRRDVCRSAWNTRRH